MRSVYGIFVLFFGFSPWLFANQSAVDELLKADHPPSGVVFEIIEGDGSDLRWAFTQIRSYSKQLRQRFPEVELAVVSHGAEQFGLLSKNAEALPQVHAMARSLDSSGIDVHVCAVHASWRDNVPEDFPDYIDVADTGPAQVRRYADLGYAVVIVAEDR